jgi:hypothetical protein
VRRSQGESLLVKRKIVQTLSFTGTTGGKDKAYCKEILLKQEQYHASYRKQAIVALGKLTKASQSVLAGTHQGKHSDRKEK